MEKEKKIAVNPSSGVEKVENVQKELAEQQKKENAQVAVQKKVTKKAVKKASRENEPQKKAALKEQKEKAAAKKRVAAALKKKRAQENRKKVQAERKARREEKMRLLAAKREERRAKRAAARRARELRAAKEKDARLEKMRALRLERKKAHEEQKAKRAAARAEQKKNKKSANTRSKNEEKKGRHQHQRAKGFGGWIAAVVVLGTLTLGLGAAAAVGAVNAAKMGQAMMMGYKGTLYELAGIMDNVDGDLDKVRLSSTETQQSRLLTDLLVQSRLAEISLEKLPVSAEEEANLTSFINRTAKVAEMMLDKLRAGEKLDERDRTLLKALYETNHAVRVKLDEAIANMTDDDMMQMSKNANDSKMGEVLRAIEEMTLPENRPNKETFSGGEIKEEKDGLDVSRAEELCRVYFKGYGMTDLEYVGETLSKSMQTYNFRLRNEQGQEVFAQVDKKSGALAEFDYYAECKAENYDLSYCEENAQNFLARLGYNDLTCVYGKQSGALVDYVFVFEQNGVVYYPDEIKVKVCMERGVVSGLDAREFLKNHHPRAGFKAKITQDEARAAISGEVEVLSEQRVVLDTRRGEKSAYEFFVSFGEEKYLIYLDALSGEEISIVNVKDLIV